LLRFGGDGLCSLTSSIIRETIHRLCVSHPEAENETTLPAEKDFPEFPNLNLNFQLKNTQSGAQTLAALEEETSWRF